jgi:serine/threonine-protein kinase
VQLVPGERVAQYEILRPLGAGGMGEVYCARDARLEREVALKILPLERGSEPEAIRRFEQEARAASALKHPNIVTIYEIDQSERFAWIAMELVEGVDLRTLVVCDPPALNTTLRIATSIVEGLAAAHDRGIVHRDLKPENVMITPEGFVKLLDFGLAKWSRVLTPDDVTLPHTSPGTIFGTVAYMSPEQATGREMDARSDQFSFGVMLYEMLTRVRPFDRPTKTETLAAILRDQALPPSSVREEVPVDIDRIVSRCLSKDPRDRYASTHDLARDLRELRDGLTQSSAGRRAVSASVRMPRRRGTLAILGLVLLLALIGGAVVWQRRENVRRITSVAVVPLRDLSGTAEGRVLADGISEMVATRLAQVRDLRVASPFDGAPIAESDETGAIGARTGVDAVVRGTVERGGGDVRVTLSLLDARTGRTLASSTASRPAADLLALQDLIADDLLRALGRTAPSSPTVAQATLGSEDQRRFTEAVGLLEHVRDERSVDRAIAQLETVLRNARESGAVNALLARALLYKSSLARRPAFVEQAMVYATRAVTLSPNDPESHVILGELQNATGRHADAMGSFQRALAMHPNEGEALVGLAQSYDKQGRAADAEAMYRKALALRPDSAGTLTRFGAFCMRQGRHADAVAYFRKAAQLEPGVAHAHVNLGAALLAQRRTEEALAAFRKSLALHPTAAGYSNVGTLLFTLGRYDEARKAYEQATQLAPSDFVMWQNLGDACRWAPDARDSATVAYQRAIDAARDALEVNPNDAYARSVLALSLSRVADDAGAQTEIRRALELDPTNPTVLYKAALIALARDQHDSAISWIERAVANGYARADLANDPELAPLRDSPAFRSVARSGS